MGCTWSFKRSSGSHSSQATFFKSEQVLNKSWASGWKTEKTVVSLTEMPKSEMRPYQALKLYLLIYGRSTFQNDANNPSLFLRSGAVIYSLHDFRLCISRCLRNATASPSGTRERYATRRCSPLRNISGDVIEGSVELIYSEAPFNN